MTAVNLATADLFQAEIARLQAVNDRLRHAINRLAMQDATLSVCNGNVTVTMDATLTDAEREAVEFFCKTDWPKQSQQIKARAATLRRLLERTAGDRPKAINGGESDRPEPIATIPPEWLQRPYWVDPPSGWRYGFPRLYDPASDGDMTEWLIRNGYPEKLARQGLACTFTAATEDGEK